MACWVSTALLSVAKVTGKWYTCFYRYWSYPSSLTIQ